MKIKLAKYIADFLVEHDITDMFTLTGGGAMHLNIMSRLALLQQKVTQD